LSFGLKANPPATVRQYNSTYRLAELLAAVEAIEEGKRVPQNILEQLEAGTSMGGARPKATIEHENRLWIGKFPEKSDRFNFRPPDIG
jgi:serine/threonine-protein kinase HipA